MRTLRGARELGSVVLEATKVRLLALGSAHSLWRARVDRQEGWIYVDQATKGTWGMSWRQEALKGVEDCDKRGVAVKQAMIP